MNGPIPTAPVRSGVMDAIFFETPAQFRAWLEEHHATAPELLVGFRRRRSGMPTMTWREAVDQALCFGWIDGVLHKLDDDRSMEWFAPRKPKSTWARSNKERVARLEAAGLMTDAGRAAIELARANGSWESLDIIDALIVPDDLAAALAERPGAREHFDASSASVRRSALAMVYQAKRPATRAERVEKIAATAARGERISSLWQRD